MGLLDDAIREHLELKRLRGADPGQVAREAEEALSPVDRGATHHPEGQAVDAAGGGRDVDGHPPGVLGATHDEQGSTHTGQETTELDMSTVLDEDSARQGPSRETDPSEQAVPVATGDSLEWEMPREQPAQPSAEGEPAEVSEKPAEDVLEETPDFLRETPEQERLWFEQRPPRDFDFDK